MQPSDLPPLPPQCATAYTQGRANIGGEYRTLSDEWCETTAKYSATQMREYARAAVAEAQRAAVPLTAMSDDMALHIAAQSYNCRDAIRRAEAYHGITLKGNSHAL